MVTDLEKLYDLKDTSYRLGFANISLTVCGKARNVHLETLNTSIATVLRSDRIDINGCRALNASIRFGNWIALGNSRATLRLCYEVYPKRIHLDLAANVTVCLYTNISSSFNNEISITINASNTTMKIYRDGELVLTTNTSTTWTDPIPGPHTYRFVAIMENRSVEKSYAVSGNRYCKPVEFRVKILPREVSNLKMNIYPNSTFLIDNLATINDTGRLEVFIENLSIFRPVGNASRPKLELTQNVSDVVLLANQTLLRALPFNLSVYKGANITVWVWIDNASTGAPQLRKFSIELGNPFAQPLCNLVIVVRDDRGNPLEGVKISFLNGSRTVNATTDPRGEAILRNVYPAGTVIARYKNHSVKTWVLGCGEHQVVIDTHPPRLLSISVKPEKVVINAIDSYSHVYAVINGSRYGPFNGTYIVYVPPGEYKICIVDTFGNKGGCTTIEVPPRPRHHTDYVLLSLYILLVGCTLYAAVALMTKSARI